jgi:hypothetical protein
MAMGLPGRRSKYGNRAVVVDGRRFASRREADAYVKLRLMEAVGTIRDLKLQVRYNLRVNAVLVCGYVADFVYLDVCSGLQVVADAKGYRTREYRIKKKLMKAVHGVDIVEL